MSKIDCQQFGAIPKSSTVYALISMIHSWLMNTDGNGTTTRVVLFDFRKAFDLIDHNILVNKLALFNIPPNVVLWIVDFLKHRKQRVKLSPDCLSEWSDLRAGVPQGTKLGAWLFLIMINDLQVPGVKLWKYVDDVTMSEFIEKNQSSNIHEAVNDLVTWSENNKFQVNEQKCKELRITFRKHHSALEPITANNTDIKNVESAKLLGITISNDLKWNAHVQEIICKVATRLYFLRQLKISNLDRKDMLLFYITCIRPVTEYACQVFHNSLPKHLCEDLERLQKRALRIIYPGSSYSEALIISGLSTLEQTRQKTENLFK